MKIEDAINTVFKSPQQKAIVNIRYTSNFIYGIQTEFMMEFDLSMPQFNILRILRGAKKAINVNTVKERMIEKSPNTTRLMDKLVAKNLIIRSHSNEDRRVVFVEISKLGLTLLQNIDVKLAENNIFRDHLSDEESEILSDLLDKVRNAI
jgi:MarR family 2-MHQ and catechol resistance regulon transcriptional repressor